MNTQKAEVKLRELLSSEEEIFIKEIQIAFDKAVIEKFGQQKDTVIPRHHVEKSLHGKNAKSFRILADGKAVGGVIVAIDQETQRNALELLYINPDCHSKGIGQKVWQLIEEKYPQTKVWETHTPYFETRNIHFYVNRLGFHIVEFFNSHHPDPHDMDDGAEDHEMPGGDGFFRFEKVMKK